MKNAPFYQKGRFWVGLFGVVVGLLLLIQASPYIITKLFPNFEFNTNVHVPIDVIGWSYMALVSMYIGSDRFEKVFSSKQLPYGEVYMGDLKKLRNVIVFTLAIFIEAMSLNFLFDVDVGLESFFLAFASSVILYVGGNNAVNTVGNIDGDKQVDEENGDANDIADALDLSK